MGFSINITYDTGTVGTAPQGFFDAITWCCNSLSSVLTDNITLNIQFGWGTNNGGALGAGVAGSSSPVNVNPVQTYATWRTAVQSKACAGSSTLPSVTPLSGTFLMTYALARALGIKPASDATKDGYVGIGSSVNWSYTQGTVGAGQYDIFGTILHEITEVMGRNSDMDAQPNFYMPLDLFRFVSSGVRSTTSFANGGPANVGFSVDSGATLLRNFNNTTATGDLGDWNGNGATYDSCDNSATSGVVVSPLSSTDLTLLNAMGFATLQNAVTRGGLCPSIW